MRPYAELTRRGQLWRLRRLGRAALGSYELQDARLTLLRHEHNTTFRVDAKEERYVLRINRVGQHLPAAIRSEVMWLSALRVDTDLVVPEPVAASDGSLIVTATDPGVPEARTCVLLRWLDGKFVDKGLAPGHMREVAKLQAGLQQHAGRWVSPNGFVRPRVDNLTGAAKSAGAFGSAVAASEVEQPSADDADAALRLVAELMSDEAVALFVAALDVVWTATRELGASPDTFGLIHADLHQENYFFSNGRAQAIDFDDCGWGFYLYDVAVTISELGHLSRGDELRPALLDEYASSRPLPTRCEVYLDAFAVLRRLQLLVWILESRDHVAFRDDWHSWADHEVNRLSAVLRTVEGRPR